MLETALSLGLPPFGYGGNKGSDSAVDAWREQVASDTRRIAEMATKEGLSIDFEYHGGTLTDTAESALLLLNAVNHPGVRCNWQPPVHETYEQRLHDLNRIASWLANVHVFHWLPGLRCPLEEGIDDWIGYADVIRKTSRIHYMMLEFVKSDSPEQFLKDAECLKRLNASVPN